jgi:hypothetical protein
VSCRGTGQTVAADVAIDPMGAAGRQLYTQMTFGRSGSGDWTAAKDC